MTSRRDDVIGVGEVLLEFAADATRSPAPAGDVFNTLVYAARLGARTALVTDVGSDAAGRAIRGALRREGIDAGAVHTRSDRPTGSYVVRVDRAGARRFTYQRKGSAATGTLERFTVASLAARLGRARWCLISGVTLAVMHRRRTLLAALRRIRAGTRIAFDPNYRAALWSDVRAYRAAVRAILPMVDLLLPSRDDARVLHPGLGPAAIVRHYARRGVACVLTDGSRGAWYRDAARVRHASAVPAHVVDSTAAGDAFNAGVLVALLRGRSGADQVACGLRLAAIVVHERGAITSSRGAARAIARLAASPLLRA